ncbi:alpha-ketoacid dehydrogenase kinase family protein, partial [Aspergillus saccharolyticus JOP 1030-1]
MRGSLPPSGRIWRIPRQGRSEVIINNLPRFDAEGWPQSEMALTRTLQTPSLGARLRLTRLCTLPRARLLSSSPSLRNVSTSQQHPFAYGANDEVARLAASRRRPLTLADLLKHGKPPLSKDALLASANFTLSLLPARLASRIEALRNLPFIVVSNPHVTQIYNNYLHSLSTLLPYQQRQVTTLEEENQFAEVLADLVHTHTNTIPILARGFLECRRYINSADVTRFLDTHLRARIGTRLIAEQHLALHFASQPVRDTQSGANSSSSSSSSNNEHTPAKDAAPPSNYIGVIDTALQPARIVKLCEDFVGEICELKYGVRPRLVIGGQPDASFAHVPVHVEYILTELLKNAFRATVESGNGDEPIEVTIAAAPDVPSAHHYHPADALSNPNNTPSWQNQHQHQFQQQSESDTNFHMDHNYTVVGTADANESIKSWTIPSAQCITIRIRDRGGGIPPEVLPNIWSYSFTTFSEYDDHYQGGGGSETHEGMEALNTIAAASGGGGGANGHLSSIAGLGYGLPLSRAYAEYFGGSIAIQSLWGWGTDVYLTLQGVGNV